MARTGASIWASSEVADCATRTWRSLLGPVNYVPKQVKHCSANLGACVLIQAATAVGFIAYAAELLEIKG